MPKVLNYTCQQKNPHSIHLSHLICNASSRYCSWRLIKSFPSQSTQAFRHTWVVHIHRNPQPFSNIKHVVNRFSFSPRKGRNVWMTYEWRWAIYSIGGDNAWSSVFKPSLIETNVSLRRSRNGLQCGLWCQVSKADGCMFGKGLASSLIHSLGSLWCWLERISDDSVEAPNCYRDWEWGYHTRVG